MKSRINITIIIFIIVIGLISMNGCRSHAIYVPVQTEKTEYKERIFRDSIRLYDSIYIHEANDTVRIERFKVIYRDKLARDSIFVIDSVQVPFPVVELQKVNELTGWQNFQIWMGRILLLAIMLIIFYSIMKSKKIDC